MKPLIRWMDRALYPRHTDNWDNLLLRAEILKLLQPGWKILDLGAGSGYVSEMNFRGLTAEVWGVDPDERVLLNPFLDRAEVGVSENIPYPDSSFDLIFANNVLEHLRNPAKTFVEVCRVLKPGGLFLAKTPNKHHYVSLLARILPLGLHKRLNRLRGRESEETFPTLYRANTPSDIGRLAKHANLQVQQFLLVEGRPEYLRIFAPAYFLGWIYERWVNTVPGFSGFRVVLIATLRRPK